MQNLKKKKTWLSNANGHDTMTLKCFQIIFKGNSLS